MPSVAIIGAGMSGLAAAHTFLDAGYTVTLFEKSHRVGGRAATRKRSGFIYDHGAQYVKEGTPTSLALITKRFHTPDLIDIQKPVWTFDQAGHIQAGDSSQNQEQKLNYRSGLNTLAQKMAEGLSIHLETLVTHVQQDQQGWQLFTTRDTFGPFDALLMTIPGPQALALIQASTLGPSFQQAIVEQLQAASYNQLISVMLGYQVRPQPRPYYALVNIDKQHAISWLAWEHEKASERVPAGAGLLIAQMAPAYSAEHFSTPDAAVLTDVAQRVATLIQETGVQPSFTDIQRWRYALPAQKADAQALNTLTFPQHLAFSGDSFVGGRLHLALEHGITVSQQFIDQFKK